MKQGSSLTGYNKAYEGGPFPFTGELDRVTINLTYT